MADLKTFAAPDVNTNYADVADSMRGFFTALSKGVVSDYAAPPTGAVNLDNPGGAVRSLTQWGGASYAGFTLAAGSYSAQTYYLGIANAYLSANTTDVQQVFDFGSLFQYNRPGKIADWYINGAKVMTADANGIGLGATSPAGYGRVVISGAPPPGVGQSALALVTKSAVSAERSYIAMYSTFANHPDTGARASGGISTGFAVSASNTSGIWGGEYLALHAGVTPHSPGAAPETVEQLRINGNGRIIQKGATDDGITALQTTSYSASNQPSLMGGLTTPFRLVDAFTNIELQIATSTLKGGVVVTGPLQTRIGVPIAGNYLLTGTWQCENQSPSQNAGAYLILYKNGLTIRELTDSYMLTSEFTRPSFSAQISLSAGDYISLSVNNRGTPIKTGMNDISLTKIN